MGRTLHLPNRSIAQMQRVFFEDLVYYPAWPYNRGNLVHLNGRQRVFLTIFWFDRLQTSTSRDEISKRTQRSESSWRHFIWNYLRVKFKFLRKHYCALFIKHIRFLCHCAKETCSDDKNTWVDSFTSVFWQFVCT